MKREMICINCPMGCMLTVDDTDKNNIIVSGNTCPRGVVYAKDEIISPKRMVTGTVKLTGANIGMVSVKTSTALPKHLIFDSLELLKKVTLTAPVKVGDIAVKDICGSGVDFVVTKNVDKIG